MFVAMVLFGKKVRSLIFDISISSQKSTFACVHHLVLNLEFVFAIRNEISICFSTVKDRDFFT